MNRLEGMEKELGDLDVALFDGSHFFVGLSLNFLRQWELYNQLFPFLSPVARSGLDFCLINLGGSSLIP